MSLMRGEEIVGSKIIHVADHDEESSTVNDVLLDFESKELGSLTLEMNKPAHEMDTDAGPNNILEWLNPFHQIDNKEKQTYLIPKVQIESIDADGVYMKGEKVEREREGDLNEYKSFTVIKNFKVETESGEQLGTIVDVVLEGDQLLLVGLQLDVGRDMKYLPYENVAKWDVKKLIVDDAMSDKLVGDPEQMTDHNYKHE